MKRLAVLAFAAVAFQAAAADPKPSTAARAQERINVCMENWGKQVNPKASELEQGCFRRWYYAVCGEVGVRTQAILEKRVPQNMDAISLYVMQRADAEYGICVDHARGPR